MHEESSNFYKRLNSEKQQKKIFSKIHGKSIEYAFFLKQIRKTISLMREFQLDPDSKIVVISNDDATSIVLFTACLLEGIPIILLDPDIKNEKLKRILTLTNCGLLFIDEKIKIVFSDDRVFNIIPIKVIDPTKQAFINKLLEKMWHQKIPTPEY